MSRNMTDYVGALDQGTSSTRFAVFDRAGRPIAIDQREYFHGCAANYYEPHVGQAAIDVLERNSFAVIVPPQVCCGLPLISNGLYRQARGASQAACDSETCRWQIEKATGTSLRHPVEILAEAYAAGDREATRSDLQGAASRLTDQ
jgi:Fe-S oxidoreductase